MTDEQWFRDLRRLAEGQSRTRTLDFETIRTALARTSLLMSAAPTSITEAYYRLEEKDLADNAVATADGIGAGEWEWSPGTLPGSAARDVGIRARALDLLLNDAATDDGPSDDPETIYLCSAADAYVIPRLATPLRTGHGSRRFFRRRGTPHHRIIPRIIGSFVQRLHRLDRLDVDPSIDRPLGASMFENFTLVHETTGERLVVKDVVCDDVASMIDDQVTAAIRAGCRGLVWPELTMPPRHIALLCERLEEEARGTGPAGPSWIMAGSWTHRDPAENAAPVLDAFGIEQFDCAKSIPFRENEIGTEDFVPRFEVPILVTDRELVAFAICRDYCDLAQQTPWSDLAVDLVVVASMGNARTMEDHRAVAQRGSANGQRTFVVQQFDVTQTGTLGWGAAPNLQARSTDSRRHECGPMVRT